MRWRSRGNSLHRLLADSTRPNTNSIGGRPDVVPGASIQAIGTQSINNWFNAGTFKIPGCPDNNPVCAKPDNIGRFGNAGIAILRGHRIANVDFAVSKYFPIHERMRLQFRMNAVNVLNHPNFALPASNISSPATVGRIPPVWQPHSERWRRARSTSNCAWSS